MKQYVLQEVIPVHSIWSTARCLRLWAMTFFHALPRTAQLLEGVLNGRLIIKSWLSDEHLILRYDICISTGWLGYKNEWARLSSSHPGVAECSWEDGKGTHAWEDTSVPCQMNSAEATMSLHPGMGHPQPATHFRWPAGSCHWFCPVIQRSSVELTDELGLCCLREDQFGF